MSVFLSSKKGHILKEVKFFTKKILFISKNIALKWTFQSFSQRIKVIEKLLNKGQ